jgi:integrase
MLLHSISPHFSQKWGTNGGQNFKRDFVMADWINTKFEGVRYREHASRKFGVRKDRYYAIRYYVDGRRKEESLGWESDWKHSHKDGTISLEQEAISRRAWLMKNKKEGTGAVTLQEQRDKEKAKTEVEKARLRGEAEARKTLSEYWQESYFPAAQRSKKENSWCKEETHFRLWIEPLFGKFPLRFIELKQWDELVKTLSAKGLSPRSKEYICGTLRRILKHAYDRRMVDDAPPSGKRIGVTGPGNNRRLRVISQDEEAAIMECLAVTDRNAWRLTRFCFLTGCRASEAFELTWANIDLARNTVMFPETKNHDSRVIPLTAPLLELLGELEQGLPGERVFTKEDGSAYYQRPSTFKTAVENLGLNEGRSKRDRLVFHSIRHSVATRLAQRLGPRDLMDVMGWRTVQMAMRYVHANQDAKMKALSMLGAAPAANVLPFVRTAENQ